MRIALWLAGLVSLLVALVGAVQLAMKDQSNGAYYVGAGVSGCLLWWGLSAILGRLEDINKQRKE